MGRSGTRQPLEQAGRSIEVVEIVHFASFRWSKASWSTASRAGSPAILGDVERWRKPCSLYALLNRQDARCARTEPTLGAACSAQHARVAGIDEQKTNNNDDHT